MKTDTTSIIPNELIPKLYEFVLSPSEAEIFLEKWVEVSEIVNEPTVDENLENHLNRAADLLSHMAATNLLSEFAADASSSKLGVECHIDLDGQIVSTTEKWRQQYGKAASIWEAYPTRYHYSLTDGLTKSKQAFGSSQSLVNLHQYQERPNSHVLIAPLNTRSGDRLYFRFVETRAFWSEQMQTHFIKSHGLTKSEVSLLKVILEGKSFSSHAEAVGKSPETLKSQSKSIYSKLGLSGREEVVRFALHLQYLLNEYGGQESVERSEEKSPKFINLKNGKRIAYWRKGATSGKPFLFIHGMVSGHSWSVEFESELKLRNLTAYCVERFGYGQSDLPDSSVSLFDEWLSIFPELLDKLGFREIPIVTHTSGVAYGALALDRYPNRAKRCLAISGGIPNYSGRLSSKYPNAYRTLHWCLKHSPAAVRFYFAGTAAFVQSDEKGSKHASLLFGRTDVDRRALKNPANLNLLLKGMRLGLTPGYRGLVGDSRGIWLDTDRWVEILAKEHSDVHLHYLCGDSDPLFNIEAMKSHCDRHNFTTFSTISGGGQLLNFTHPKEIADRIEKLVINHPDWSLP